MKYQIYFFIFCLVLCSSCEKKFTRDTAEKIIKEQGGFPKTVTVKLSKSSNIYLTGSNWDKKTQHWLSSLMNLGEYIEESMIAIDNGSWVQIALKEKGKEFLLNEDEYYYTLKAHEIEFSDITGILFVEQPYKYAQVDYVLRVVNATPFDQLYEHGTNEMKKSERFVKYDDGWRLEH